MTASSGSAAVGFDGTDRFEVLRCLGAGGMGVVYAARDRERDREVALKTLRKLEPNAIYRFKNEFRALADITHPNLATLYELLSETNRWFFTMELVDGVDFISYVRGQDAGQAMPKALGKQSPDLCGSAALTEMPGTPDANTPTKSIAGLDDGPVAVAPPVHVGRLRDALQQLAEGLSALHRSGHLHRDIKPSNILVTISGRVVILDFGLVADLRAGGDKPGELFGTPVYMAPEQAGGGAQITPACDWYSVGVVLYEALTGRRPFEGDPAMVLQVKRIKEPSMPAARVPGVPDDLNELCAALLRIDPAERPAGEEVLARLTPARSAGASKKTLTAPRPAADVELVGRSAHMQVLEDAFEAAASGRGLALFVHGGSGIGKSELVHRFLSELEARDEAVVLKGRCYERESVPFKGVDSLVDALASHLLARPRHEVEALMPVDVVALGQVMPVLRRVPAVAEARRRANLELDPHELRRRAFRALRELLTRLAARYPTVLFVDDVHWGDADSGALLAEIMHPPDTPPLLLVGTYRTEEARGSPLLAAFLRREERLGPASYLRTLKIGPLDADESRALAAHLLGQSGVGDDHAEAIANESAGNPYFIHELARFVGLEAGAQSGPTGLTAVRLDDVVLARIARFPREARELLELVCVAGRPVERRVTRRAAGPAEDDGLGQAGWPATSAMEILRTHHLVRLRGSRDRDLVEPYHDRIREAVVASLSQEALRGHHRRIAEVLETIEPLDLEALAYHYTEAGEDSAAVHYAILTADAAFSTCAFENAADWYAIATNLQRQHGESSAESLRKLGDALANAGRGRDAADAYRKAGALASGDEAMTLRARAAGELLRSGHLDEGIEELRPGLAAVGIRLARHPWRGLLSLFWRRVQVTLRGLAYRERDLSEIAPTELTRADLCWAGACGFSMTDMIWGAELQTRHLSLALRSGDPYRIGRALTLEVAYHSVSGPRAGRRVAKLMAALEECARRTGEPSLEGMLRGTGGLAAYQFGHWKRARELGEEAVRIFRDQCVGVRWEATSAQIYLLWALYYLGEVAELGRAAKRFRDEAAQCGDRYAAATMSIGVLGLVELAADRPDVARERVAEAISSWSARDFHLQHYFGMLALAHCELYQGDGGAALERVQKHWRDLQRAFHLRVHIVRHEVLHLRARATLAAAATSEAAPKLLRAARRDARRIARERAPWAVPLARLVRAGADFTHAPTKAAAQLELAENELEAAGMQLFAWIARRRRGELVGGEAGERLIAGSRDWMEGQGIRDGDAIARLFVPVYRG